MLMEFEPRILPMYIAGRLALDLTRFRKLACRNRVRNKVPEKVWMRILKKIRTRSRDALVQCQIRFKTIPKKFSEKIWEALVPSQVSFGSNPERIPEKIWQALVQNQVSVGITSGQI